MLRRIVYVGSLKMPGVDAEARRVHNPASVGSPTYGLNLAAVPELQRIGFELNSLRISNRSNLNRDRFFVD